MSNYETAVAKLRTATTVEQWNDLRDEVKDTLSTSDLYKVDASGLIVEVLGADARV